MSWAGTSLSIYGYILSIVLNMFFYGITVVSLYSLGWFLCQNQSYSTIILKKILFCAYNDNYQLWSFISLFIRTLTKLLSKQRSIYFEIFVFLYCYIHRFLCVFMLYNVWLSLCHPSVVSYTTLPPPLVRKIYPPNTPDSDVIWNSVFGDHILTLLVWWFMIPFEILCWGIKLYFVSSSSLTIQLYIFFQVINYNWIKTIKREQTFDKSSNHNQWRPPKKKEYLARYQLELNLIKKIQAWWY